MSQHFMQGFHDELSKQAGHPLFETVTRGGTLLGQQVRGMMRKAVRRARKLRTKARRGAGLKSKLRLKKKAGDVTQTLPKPPTSNGPMQPPAPRPMPAPGGPQGQPMPSKPPKPIPMQKSSGAPEASEDAGRVLKEVLDQAQAPSQKGDQIPMGVTDPDYGAGLGNFKGRQAPSFTSSTKGGKPGNPTENPDRFGCGFGSRKTAGLPGLLGKGALGALGLYGLSRVVGGGKKAVKASEEKRKGRLSQIDDYGTGRGYKTAQMAGIGTPPLTGGGMTPPPPAPSNVGPRMGTGTGKKCPEGQHPCPTTGKCVPIGTGDGQGPRREPGRPRRRQMKL